MLFHVSAHFVNPGSGSSGSFLQFKMNKHNVKAANRLQIGIFSQHPPKLNLLVQVNYSYNRLIFYLSQLFL
jgi:hypothetical protein